MEGGYVLADNLSPLTPKVWAAFTMCFDCDFDINIISKNLGELPYDAKATSQCRVSQFTGKHNPGYWEIRSEAIFTYESSDCVVPFCAQIRKLMPGMKNILCMYSGTSFFRLFIDIESENEFPNIALSSDVLAVITELDATLEVVVRNMYPA